MAAQGSGARSRASGVRARLDGLWTADADAPPARGRRGVDRRWERAQALGSDQMSPAQYTLPSPPSSPYQETYVVSGKARQRLSAFAEASSKVCSSFSIPTILYWASEESQSTTSKESELSWMQSPTDGSPRPKPPVSLTAATPPTTTTVPARDAHFLTLLLAGAGAGGVAGCWPGPHCW